MKKSCQKQTKNKQTLNLIQPIKSQDMKGPEQYDKLWHRNAVSRILTTKEGNPYGAYVPTSSTDTEGKKRRERKTRFKTP